MYKAKYIPRRDPLLKEYWRTITNANSLNEATRIADRFTRKGYICVGVTAEFNNN